MTSWTSPRSKRGKLEITSDHFALQPVIADVRSMMQVRATEKNLAFRVEFEGLMPQRIESDPKRLRQILINLIGNAIKFTESGEVRLIVRYGKNDSKIQFLVRDTGIGITTDQQTRLFEKFFTR